MIVTNEKRVFLPAWGISVLLHGLSVGSLLALSSQVKPIVSEEIFQWDVALVESTKSESLSEQSRSSVPKQPSQARVLSSPPSPKGVKEVSKTGMPIKQKVEPLQPALETVRPSEQKVEDPPVQEEPVEQRVVEAAAPVAEPIAEAKMAEPVAVVSAPVSPSEVAVPQEIPVQASAPTHSVENLLAQAAKASVSGSETKADHRWLAESLWRRVAELKRYPSSARMNGQEGKVILKAVIRSDGHLADVFIQKSSGHSDLDAAAIEVVKLACPLHMKHSIDRPQIVVSLPIVYSLAN